MGRQFTYYCLADDLTRIQEQVFGPAGGRLVSAEKVDGAHRVVDVERFALEDARMGSETIFLYLLPPREMELEIRNGPWIDSSKSHLIEVGRCFTEGQLIRSARFWYETRFLEESQLRTKPPEFVEWAEGVFRSSKKLLQRQTVSYRGHPYTEWFGRAAWAEVSSGRLQPVRN